MGGAGADLLTGGTSTDADIFKWVSETETGTSALTCDTVSDFSGIMGGQNDILDFSQIDADTSQDLNQAFVFNGTTAAANSVWVAASGSDTIVSADVNGDSTADLSVRLTGINPAQLQSGDFIV